VGNDVGVDVGNDVGVAALKLGRVAASPDA
jgi:hypothetical protein